ncbi:VOC family protein [Parvibaculum sp.]|uniref:VOC family protein n=1 Tax=Parvibaculum sp. TaxID=2024848 RepID=UPI002BA9F595|nr:VOC family protein [Parvibaculum sp.]HUD53222.1 VOC family protein [Parvibaculum sp.]
MLTGIDHVQIAIPEKGEDEARRFYLDVLGFTEVPKPPVQAARGGAWFERGPLKLHLGVDKDFHPATKAHVAFLTDDLDGLAARAHAGGYRLAEDVPVEGYDRLFVFDPFGNRIELMQPK